MSKLFIISRNCYLEHEFYVHYSKNRSIGYLLKEIDIKESDIKGLESFSIIFPELVFHIEKSDKDKRYYVYSAQNNNLAA